MEHDWPMSTIWQLTGDVSNWPYRAPKFTSESRPMRILAHMKKAAIPISIFIISVFTFRWDSRKNKAQTFALVIPLFVNDRRPNNNLFETEIVLHINFRYLP